MTAPPPPAQLMQATEEAAALEVQTPLSPPIWFGLSNESVRFNSELLKENSLDLEKFLVMHQDATLNFGSDFHLIDELEKILGNHQSFGFFSGVLAEGADHRFTVELSREQQKAKVTAMV